MTDTGPGTPDEAAVAIPDGLPPLPSNASNLLPEAIDVPALTTTLEGVVGLKPGLKTTEFWVSLGVGALNSVAAVALLLTHRISSDQASTMLTGGGALAAVYTLGRSWVKAKTGVNPPPLPTISSGG